MREDIRPRCIHGFIFPTENCALCLRGILDEILEFEYNDTYLPYTKIVKKIRDFLDKDQI